MADERGFLSPNGQRGQHRPQADTDSYYPDNQPDYHQTDYEEYTGHTGNISMSSQYSTYNTGPQSTYSQYNYQQQQAGTQYNDQTGHSYPSPPSSSPTYGHPPPPPIVGDYPPPTGGDYPPPTGGDYPPPTGSDYYPPPTGGYYPPSGQGKHDPYTVPAPVPYDLSGQYPSSGQEKSDFNANSPPYDHQKGQFDVYNDFNNFVPPLEDDGFREPSNSATSPTYPYNGEGNAEKMHDPGRDSIAAAPLPVNKRRRRCCSCCRCCSRRVCVISTFVILIILAVVGFFCFPRVPKVQVIDTAASSTKPGGIITKTRLDIRLALVAQVDNTANWIPFHFNRIEIRVRNRDSVLIATGLLTKYKLDPRKISNVNIPFTVFYKGNDTDSTVSDFIDACTKTGANRRALNLDASIKLFIWGIDWAYKPTINTGATGLNCPYTLPVSSDPLQKRGIYDWS